MNEAGTNKPSLAQSIWRTLNTTPTDRLSYHVERLMRQWRRTSGQRAERRNARGLRSLDHWSRHPVAFLIILAAFSIAFAFVLELLNDGTVPLQFMSIPILLRSTLDQLETLWAIQATVTAVVYPLVLGFVGLLLQGRSLARVRMHLYLVDTGARPAGLASAALVAILGVAYLFVAVSGDLWIEMFLIPCLYWFVVTAILTARFLYRTLDFLFEEHQLRAFERYAIYVALPREVHGSLMSGMFHKAQSQGLLPGEPSYSRFSPGRSTESKAGPKIDLLPSNGGRGCVSTHSRRRRAIVDVRLRLLRWGLFLWLVRAYRYWDKSPEKDWPNEPELMVLGKPRAIVHGTKVLVSATSGPCPTWSSRHLIRRAFVLRSVSDAEGYYSTREILRELVSELRMAAGSESSNLISERLEQVKRLHLALLSAGSMVDEAGTADNMGLLPSLAQSGTLSEDWIAEYKPWLKECFDQLGERDRGFWEACFLTGELFEVVKTDPLVVPIQLLDIHRSLLAWLTEWWTRQAEEQGLLEASVEYGVTLRPPYFRRYARALELARHGWEKIRLPAESSQPKTREQAWEQAARRGRFERCMLQEIAGELLRAVARNDPQAARVFAESFIGWPNRQIHRFHLHLQTITGIPPFVTVVALDQQWNTLGIDTDEADQRSVPVADFPETVCDKALLALWIDLRHLLLLLTLAWTKQGDPQEPAFETALTLVRGDPEYLGISGTGGEFTQPNHVLLQVIRQHYIRSEYTKRLDRFCEGAFHEATPPPLLGRIQTRVGYDDMRKLNHELVQLLHALAPQAAFISRPVERQLAQVSTGFDEELAGRAETLARELKEDLDQARLEDAPLSWRFRDQAIIAGIREAAGLAPLEDITTYPWVQVPWVNGALACLAELPSCVIWKQLEPVNDADGLGRSCGRSWRYQ